MIQCKSPLWRGDDFSPCFETIYLQTLLPLIACALSVLIIVCQHAIHTRKQWHLRNSSADQVRLVDDENEDSQTEPDEDESLSELTLQKTFSHPHQSTIEADRPWGQVFVVTFEVLLLLTLVALEAVQLTIGYTGGHAQRRAHKATLAVWIYVTLLTLARLYVSATRRQLPFTRLWNHTANLYALMWLCYVWIFRTALIRNNALIPATASRFAMISALLAIALCSRTGNTAVLLEYEGDIEPSKEPLASPLSIATFSWVDPIVWRGYQRTLELSDVWNVALKDKAETVLVQFRQVKKTHSLAVRLLIHFKKDVLVQGLWCMMASVVMFMPTLLLKFILEYLEDPVATPSNAAWLYVILLFVSGIFQAVGDGRSLWIGRRICIQLRAIIVGEIYSKTLRRKAAATADKEPTPQDSEPEKSMWQRLSSNVSRLFGSGKPKKSHASAPEHTKPDTDESMATNGTIINLMSIDSFKVAEICAYLHFLWAAVPVQMIMAVILLYNVLGFSSLAGIGLMILVLPLNLYIAKAFQAAQKRIMAATDKRIHATNEVLQNIRIIKYFAWEQRFRASVDEKRQVEMAALWKKYLLWSLAATVWSAIPVLITFVSFLIYTVVEKRPLVPSVAFPALSMFSLLRIPLDQLADMVAHVQESKVSVDRVEEYLNEEETEKYHQMKMCKNSHLDDPKIALENATLTWGSKAENMAQSFRLIDIDVSFQVGKLNIIAGQTGSGKTSLLMALLGEMKLMKGGVYIPGGSVRQDLRPDPQTGLTESVAYCAQQAWLVNATIKENVLFSCPYDHRRYKAVLSACALKRDLEILDAGDQTLVGEKGITLSGGQKQRISLARALYSNSRHLLLDDCLSAVDSHTAKHIFQEAISGELIQNRTCILVSHNVALTVPEASYVVVLNNGKVTAKGTPEQIMSSGMLGDELTKSRPPSRGASAAPSRVGSTVKLNKMAENNDNPETDLGDSKRAASVGTQPEPEQSEMTKPFVDPRIEAKATGSVKSTTIKMYLQAMGPWYYWVFAATAFVATQVGSVATNVWIRQWANAYHTSGATRYLPFSGKFSSYAITSAVGLQGAQVHPPATKSLNAFPLSLNGVDAGYYLGVYALLGGLYVMICLSRELILFWGSLHASNRIHERLLKSIMRAKFRFFDSTPLGQMTNRFSKDVQSVDQEVAPVAIGLIHSAASVVTIVVLISVITPGFLIPGFFIAILYVATGMFYIRSSRDLKRIEAVQRSPLFQHFGETLTGVVTIRAYGDESRFMNDSHNRVNTHNRPFIYLWATNRWLAFRMDVAGALVSFFSGMFIVINAKSIDPGLAGLALSYAITFTQNVLWLVRLYAANEQNMNAVERIQEYIDVDQEAAARIPETAPDANWPSHGAVEFIDYSTRYRTDLDLVLKKVTFKIQPGEKVGVVGRTGAGKSSMALALFRGLEAVEGKILVDDVDVGLIGLQNLREAITIVPQDPTLFSGTLRSNLDPFELFTDEEVFAAMRKVQLIGDHANKSGSSSPEPSSNASTLVGSSSPKAKTQSPNGTSSSRNTPAEYGSKDNKNIFLDLSAPIAESGSNLSQGQRQLLCLARALLKSPKVLVMDEATASIDYATDTRIQHTLRELKNHTLVTIAHRLQTIIDYDKILVLDNGEVVEYDNPWELIKKEQGAFRGMCEQSGQFDGLFDLAKKTWEQKRLIDDS